LPSLIVRYIDQFDLSSQVAKLCCVFILPLIEDQEIVQSDPYIYICIPNTL